MTKEELTAKTISAISLGCDKNRVDLEHMLFALREYGFKITTDTENADIIIVNTCAFIAPAVVEAIDAINDAIECKTLRNAEKIIVSGCFPNRNLDILKENYPEIDYFMQTKENSKIVQIIENLYGVKNVSFCYDECGRLITNESNYAYLKIADGCDNGCAYCTIPRIRGRFCSVPMKTLIHEAKILAGSGYKELILVAQDTAKYGWDIEGKSCLLTLLKELVKIKGIQWLRLQYIYPEWVTNELLEFIVKEKKMCKYLDMPLQHIDNDILIAMNRKTHEEKTRALVDSITQNYPEITLRSTFIVGLPTENRKRFKKLCDFINEGKIHYATFFPYYREEKTKACYIKQQVPKFIKLLRLKKIQKLQNIVINKQNFAKIGTIEEVMIDSFDENLKIFIGHSKNNSPNVDLCVIIEYTTEKQNEIKLGEIYKVQLVELTDSGFKGEIL